MKALSIRQPWAWAILHAGKDVENRDWGPRSPSLYGARQVMNSMQWGGLFLIHAAAGMTHDEFDGGAETIASINPVAFRSMRRDGLERGGFVGVARLVRIVDQSTSPWFFGRVGLVLRDVRSCKFTPFKGSLGFFDVPDDIAREALAG